LASDRTPFSGRSVGRSDRGSRGWIRNGAPEQLPGQREIIVGGDGGGGGGGGGGDGSGGASHGLPMPGGHGE